MKKLYTLLVIAAFAVTIFAQAPSKMSYQAVIRNSSGALVVNQAVGMKISILQGSATGTVVFSETYSPNPQTNANGLVTVDIGGGTATIGSFSAINWSSGTYYLRTETDPAGGTNYTITGTSQLLSVPYALHAKTVESLAAESDPVFSASPASGIISSNITNWNTAFGWGNHSALYRSASWLPSWADVTGKPAFAAVATSGSYNDLLNRPVLFSGAWTDITGKPTTLAGYGITDADNSNTNEIQTLSLSGTQLSLSLGGGTVTLPSSGGGDNWGTQVVVTDATLAGNGTTATPLRIADNGVTSAKIADGTIVRADLAENSVTSEKIVDGTIATADLADNVITNAKIINTAVTTDKLANSAVTAPKLASMGATAGNVLKFNGSTWAPDFDEGLTIPYAQHAPSAYALFTIINESTGAAIHGRSDGGYGIEGVSYSTSGVGVRGLAEADNGTNFGVYGRSESPDGYGVVGYGAASSGYAVGVRGESSSTGGRGVFGMASAATGVTYGVRGRSESTSGYGVSGFAAAGSGITYGVYGESASNQGRGVWGYTSAASGITYAVAGRAASTEGRGVFGDATATSGTNFGVYGKTASPDGAGVFGHGEAASGYAIGVRGESISPKGYGVYGVGKQAGVIGIIYPGSVSGAAAIEGECYNSDGYSGYFRGGRFCIFGNTGIGTINPTQELDVHGNARFRFIASDAYYGVLNRKQDGTLTIATSDIYFKDNIKPLQKSLYKIMQLRGVSFTWKSNPEYGIRIGFIAQEFEKVIPELVFTNEVDNYKGINYAEVSAILVEAIKEQQQQIEEQQKQIDELRQLVKSLMQK